jgi:quercetin dioxygenase-like cupin family protein
MIEIDLKIRHHFWPGGYAKEMHLPTDHYAVSHRHEYDHVSMLAAGRARVDVDGESTEYVAPAFIMIRAHAEHTITALDDVTWFCMHATDVTDPEHIDKVLIEKVT